MIQIFEIKSLEEFDALVAERIFDLHPPSFIPEYSIDIFHTWQVALEVKLFEDTEDGFYRLEKFDDLWYVTEYSNYDSEGNYYALEDEAVKDKFATIAICLAALKIKGIEVKLNLSEDVDERKT